MTSGIYQITCIPTGKIYIGSSRDIDQRWRSHLRIFRLGKHFNSHLQNAWNKYGEQAFVFDVLEFCSIDRLSEREQVYLDTLKPFDDQGFNLLPEVDRTTLGYKHTAETRAHMSQARLGNQNARGSIRSEEQRRKIGQSKIGRKYSLGLTRNVETREKIRRALKGRPGYKRTAETLKKQSEAQKLAWVKRKQVIDG